MIKIQFMKELSDRGWLISRELGISQICRISDCSKECILRQACDDLFEDLPPEANIEDFEELFETYPELRIVL